MLLYFICLFLMYLVSIVVFVLIVNFFRSFQFIMQTILRFSREEKNVRHNILFTFNNFFIFFSVHALSPFDTNQGIFPDFLPTTSC